MLPSATFLAVTRLDLCCLRLVHPSMLFSRFHPLRPDAYLRLRACAPGASASASECLRVGVCISASAIIHHRRVSRMSIAAIAAAVCVRPTLRVDHILFFSDVPKSFRNLSK